MPTLVERFPSRKVAYNNEINKETNKSGLLLDDRLGLHRFILVWVVNEDILEFGHESIVFLKESERLQRVPVALLQLQMNLSHMLYILFRKLDWMPMNLLSRCFASLSLLLLRLDRPIRFRIIVENLLFTRTRKNYISILSISFHNHLNLLLRMASLQHGKVFGINWMIVKRSRRHLN